MDDQRGEGMRYWMLEVSFANGSSYAFDLFTRDALEQILKVIMCRRDFPLIDRNGEVVLLDWDCISYWGVRAVRDDE